MSEDLPVQGTILSSSPCTVKDAAALLGKFLQSDSVPETGLLRGYLESVTSCLEELACRQPSKRKEKKSRNDSEADRHSIDVQGHATTSGLHSETVISVAENQNGQTKGSGKKRKVVGVENEHAGKRMHPNKKAVDDAVENDESRLKKKSHKKKKEGAVDAGDIEPGDVDQSHFDRNDGGVHLDSNERGGEQKHHKKRKDRGLDVETNEAEIRQKKRKKRIEQ